MVNYRLKSLILEVVENQLRDKNPPVTREVYEKLQEAGYSSQEAKEKIGAIVIEEIYDISKGLREFDERKYTKALKKMLRKSISEELREDYEEWRDDEVVVLNPVVKEQKIYPNDPCLCGSGLKYKKCCGKK